MGNLYRMGIYVDFWSIWNKDKVALRDGERSITYGDLEDNASHLAAALQVRGLGCGDPVVIFMPNCIEYAVVMLAGMKIGLNMASANILSKAEEIQQLIGKVTPRCVFVFGEKEENIVFEAAPDMEVIRASMAEEVFRQLLNSEKIVEGYPVDPGLSWVAIPTSGSTGKMKFVARSYLSQITTAQEVLRAHRLTSKDVAYISLPVTQQFGMIVMMSCLIAGCTLIISSHFKAEEAFRLIEEDRITVQFGVPTMYAKEIELYENLEQKPDLSSLRVGMLGGAACAPDIIRWFETNIGCRLLNCYGLTETAVATMVDYDDPPEWREHTSGAPLRYVILKVVDENHREVERGRTGEIVCCTPTVMEGYVAEPELTAAAFGENGCVYSGDIGWIDENGCLNISGRKKDMIIRGGYNIFPAEVEEKLLRHEDIEEAAVFGQKDDILGEKVIAVVRVRDGAPKDEHGLLEQLKQVHAKHKLPDRILFVDELPRLANGKTNYIEVRKLAEEAEK